jgi:hypothetical protein
MFGTIVAGATATAARLAGAQAQAERLNGG